MVQQNSKQQQQQFFLLLQQRGVNMDADMVKALSSFGEASSSMTVAVPQIQQCPAMTPITAPQPLALPLPTASAQLALPMPSAQLALPAPS